MLMSHIKPSSSPPTCYFSIPVIPNTSSHFSTETPSLSPQLHFDPPSDPSNPLLALRETHFNLSTSPTSPGMDASKLLQLQTAAAYSVHRPNPRPLQTENEQTSDDSSSSSSSISTPSNGPASTPSTPVIRCCRCHRSSSSGSSGMISFGTNLYYCSRCASIVGYGG